MRGNTKRRKPRIICMHPRLGFPSCRFSSGLFFWCAAKQGTSFSKPPPTKTMLRWPWFLQLCECQTTNNKRKQQKKTKTPISPSASYPSLILRQSNDASSAPVPATGNAEISVPRFPTALAGTGVNCFFQRLVWTGLSKTTGNNMNQTNSQDPSCLTTCTTINA